MFRSFLSLAAIMLATTVNCLGQTPKVALSASFPEPEDGASRLLSMKNGNTLYLHFTLKDGIAVTVYNPQHQQQATATVTSKDWNNDDMKHSELRGLYEINGQAVIFLLQVANRKPSFYRIIVDGETGKLVKEDKLAELHKNGYVPIGATSRWGDIDPSNFYVEKDPTSDYYAVILYTYLEDNKDVRMTATLYAPDHSAVNQAYFEVPRATFKTVDYQAAYVHRDEYIFLAALGKNEWRDKDAQLMTAVLKKGDKHFQVQTLKETRGFCDPVSGVQYDAGSQTLALLTTTESRNLNLVEDPKHRDNGHVTALIYIDPRQLTVKHFGFIKDSYISDYAKRNMDYKDDYKGLPQDFRMNADGTLSVMLEEVNPQDLTASRGFSAGSLTQFFNIGIASFDKDGKEINGYGIAKRQQTDGYFPFWRNYRRDKGSWAFHSFGAMGNHATTAFYSYQYLHPANAEYVLFNDYNKNIRSSSESPRDRDELVAASESSTVCYRITNGKMEKFFLYGDPGDEDIHRYSIMESTIHDAAQQKIVTIMVEKTGRKDPKAHIAWIDFE